MAFCYLSSSLNNTKLTTSDVTPKYIYNLSLFIGLESKGDEGK